jgi:hypothetical protein
MAARRKLGDLLLEAGLINDFQLRAALSDQEQWQRPLGVTLIHLGFVDEAEVTRVLSQQLRCPVVDLEGKVVAPDVIELLPYEVAREHHCLPLAVQRKGSSQELYLGMSDPTDLAVVDDVAFRTGLEVRPVLVGDTQLEDATHRNYRTVDIHDGMKQITPDDIGEPGTATNVTRPEVAAPQPEAPQQEGPFAPADEHEFPLTNGVKAFPGDVAAQSPTSQGYLLQALIQLLISRELIDPNELLSRVESIRGDRE